jgi:arginyl-tRNA synthetase
LGEVEDRHPKADPNDRRRVAEQIAVGALRYFMLKYTRGTVIAFDFHEALSFEGETGPYVQYAAVRAGNILRKYQERAGQLPDFSRVLNGEVFEGYLTTESLWQLVLLVSKFETTLDRAIASGEPAHVAKYAFQLAQSFNNFYHDQPVITEEDEQRRAVLLWLTQFVRDTLLKVSAVLGIEHPAYM